MKLRRVAVALVSASVGLSAAACGGEAAGSENSPIVIAFANNESSAIQAAAARESVQAAVKWVNEEKGGLGGRQIKLETCAAQGTPESNSTCANELVLKNPVAMVIQGVTDEAAYVNATKALNIPVFVANGSGATLSSTHSFSINAGIVGLHAAVATYAKKAGVSNVGLMVTDIPAARTPAEKAVEYYQKAGTTATPVFAPAGSADMTAALKSATSKNEGLIFATLDPASCISTLRAKKSLGYSGTYMQSAACYTKDVLAAAGDAANGILVPNDLAVTGTTDEDPDVKQYEEILGRYAPDAELSTTHARQAFASFMLLYQGVLEKLVGKEYTAATVLEGARSIAGQPIFLGKGATATCNGQVAAGLPGVCSATYQMYRSEGGKLIFAETIDASPIIK